MIDFERFLDWAERRFDDVVVNGDEIKINSVFAEDHKQHLWCNPYGGKNDRPNGVFHCWKTDTKGSLVSLVMKVDDCTYEEALEILGGSDVRMAELEKQVNDLFTKKQVKPVEENEEENSDKLSLPHFTYAFEDLPSSSYHRVNAEIYLFNRKLSTQGLMVCTGGQYKQRIIIPYYNVEGNLIYFNGRYIGESKKVVKYLGPDKEVGIGKGDVIYMPEWPEKGATVFLSEGELDALSIKKAGLKAGAFGGKSLTENQIVILRNTGYIPVICLDADKAGKYGQRRMADQLLAAGFPKFGFVRPPEQYKDWNALLQKFGEKILFHYIQKNVKSYSGSHETGDWDSLNLQYNDL
jgi:DNA primase